MISTYASALEVVLDHPAPDRGHALTIGVSVYLYIKVPKGFFPQQDTGTHCGQYRRPAAHLLSGSGGKGEMV